MFNDSISDFMWSKLKTHQYKMMIFIILKDLPVHYIIIASLDSFETLNFIKSNGLTNYIKLLFTS